MRIDFHSHVMPSIDDGALNAEQSIKMLKALKADNVDVVVATPHFYPHNETLETFLERRAESYSILCKATEGLDLPDVVLGAEVYFSTALARMSLERICIANTDYIMLELPYQKFNTTFMNSLSDFIGSCGVRIILAHVERYFESNSAEVLEEIFSNNLLFQINCDSFKDRRLKKKLLELVGEDMVHLLGTDAHSPDKYRKPDFAAAESIIRRKLSGGAFERLMYNAQAVLENQSI